MLISRIVRLYSRSLTETAVKWWIQFAELPDRCFYHALAFIAKILEINKDRRDAGAGIHYKGSYRIHTFLRFLPMIVHEHLP